MKFSKLLSTLLLVAIMALPSFAEDDQDDVISVVYQCDFSDPKRVHLMINTINNAVKYYQDNMIDFKIDVVAFGPCLQYVMKDFKNTGYKKMPYIDNGGPTGSGTASRIQGLLQLAGDSMNVHACSNTMGNTNVKPEQIASGVSIVPSGLVTIVEFQKQGSSYIKIK